MIDLEHLKKLLARVKSGEWYLMEQQRHGDRSVISELEIWNEDNDILVATEVRRAPNDGGRDTLELIAAAHNALPSLLAELTELRDGQEWQSLDTAPDFNPENPDVKIWTYWPDHPDPRKTIQLLLISVEWWRYLKHCGDLHPTHWKPCQMPSPPA